MYYCIEHILSFKLIWFIVFFINGNYYYYIFNYFSTYFRSKIVTEYVLDKQLVYKK